jgi:hypothetical protein
VLTGFGNDFGGRNYNVAKATKMLEDTIKWRREFGIDNIHTEYKDTIALENSTGKMYVRGFDKEGVPLIYMKPVKENTKDHTGNIKHLVYSMERAVACMEAKGQGNTKLSLVIDYDGYTSAHAPPMKTALETLNILQSHYPERLKHAYCVRAPFMFYAFFKMVSPFIDPVTRAKICMLKNADIGNPNCKLMQDVGGDVLESCVGGKDSRPFVSSLYLAGPFEQDFRTILEREEAAQRAGAAPPPAQSSEATTEAATAAATVAASESAPAATTEPATEVAKPAAQEETHAAEPAQPASTASAEGVDAAPQKETHTAEPAAQPVAQAEAEAQPSVPTAQQEEARAAEPAESAAQDSTQPAEPVNSASKQDETHAAGDSQDVHSAAPAEPAAAADTQAATGAPSASEATTTVEDVTEGVADVKVDQEA